MLVHRQHANEKKNNNKETGNCGVCLGGNYLDFWNLLQ